MHREKFVADFMLGRLAKWLRIIGYDTVFYTSGEKKPLYDISSREKRILITRNTQVSRKRLYKVVLLKECDLGGQIRSVVKSLGLEVNPDEFFKLCSFCGRKTDEIPKDEAKSSVPEFVFDTTEKFYNCRECGRIYWKGTHMELFNRHIKEILGI